MSNTLTALVERVGQTPLLTTPGESLRRLWLASLGAYSLAAKASIQALETLVREGQALNPMARQQLAEKSTVLSNSATAAIARAEELFKERIVQPLDFLVLATRRDVEQLATRVLQLASEVQKLAAGRIEPTTEPISETADLMPPTGDSSVVAALSSAASQQPGAA